MLTGIFEQQVDMNNVISFLKEIRAILPKIRLNVIGHVEETTIKLFSKNGVSKNIVFHGSLPYNEAMKKMATYYLGITSYEVLNSYTYYADSLKIREYAVAGLPIVCDTIYGTAEEVKRYGAGLVYSTTLEMVEAVETLCKDEELYRRKSLNALAWAKKMDKGRLLINFFKHI
jgi:glycosyltransferase involved in cell wall biosynthesis